MILGRSKTVLGPNALADFPVLFINTHCVTKYSVTDGLCLSDRISKTDDSMCPGEGTRALFDGFS